MGRLVMVTGGARSGKSGFAQRLAEGSGGKVMYIATAVPFDDGMRDRIKKHREGRPAHWNTREMHRDFARLGLDSELNEASAVLLDCVTVMVTNLMVESGLDFDCCPHEDIDRLEEEIRLQVDEMLGTLSGTGKNVIVVTNEVGMGLVPAYRMGNIFRDIAGRINQSIAEKADEVYFMVSGISMKIK